MDGKRRFNAQAAKAKRSIGGSNKNVESTEGPAPKKQITENVRGPIGDEDAPDVEEEVEVFDEDVFMDEQDMRDIEEESILDLENLKETLKNWRRPHVATFDASTHSIGKYSPEFPPVFLSKLIFLPLQHFSS